MYSVVHEGRVLDFSYKKLNEDHYAFYIGEILIGQTFKMRAGWSAVSNLVPNPLGVIEGFKTRYNASIYMLKQCKIIDR